MRLFELFDYKAEYWDQTKDNSLELFYETFIDNDKIEIMYYRYSDLKEDWQVAFRRNGKTTQTSEGNANKIFSAVINHILEWVKQHQPRTLSFSGDKSGSSSRVNLYSRMIDRYAQNMGYRVETEDLDSAMYFILVKMKQDS